jgi:hypothetical protein
MLRSVLTFSNTDVEFNVRPLHVLMMSSTNWLSAHIVPVIDTMATFTSSTRNKANAFSIKKNVDVSWIKQGSNCSHISMFYKRNTNGLDLRSDGLLGYRPLEWWLTSLSGWKLFVLSRVNLVFSYSFSTFLSPNFPNDALLLVWQDFKLFSLASLSITDDDGVNQHIYVILY